MQEAMLYESRPQREVACGLCHHACVIKPGRRGICGVRENHGGRLMSLVYGQVIADHVDPIEKKPLYHFYPGSLSYSIATVGCNFRCRFCQNADIAQMPQGAEGRIAGHATTPEAIVAAAQHSGCRSIAYTYTEPTVYFELALLTSRIAHARGIKNVFVTNGYMTRGALDSISPVLDAANVDLKAFSDDFYQRYCGARLQPVLETLQRMKAADIWVEVTTLLIPEINDSTEELEKLAAFIVSSLGKETPWHISRFHPTHRMLDRPVTPAESLIRAYHIGVKAGLQYVYTGNAPGLETENTLCPACESLLIERRGFAIRRHQLTGGRCNRCSAEVGGVGMDKI